MIVECGSCHTRYKISEERVPTSGVKVKCPKCKAIFEVKREVEEREETLGEKLFGKAVVGQSMWPVRLPGGETGVSMGEGAAPGIEEESKGPDEAPAVAADHPSDAPGEARPEPEETFKEKEAGVAEEDPRTLARALVSDILFYNRKERDEGLAQDKILAFLGKEIARSWEIYKERVGIETAIETEHFREAVNEILGEGNKVL
ncbi:MAG: zinc-ribbon domain-containing protein [Candidatus Eiseniibacteriota bacterium]|nr:MAG: zinc-ribbon domain-containing protein [Candidatus Eisenbacteria bacterium]